MQRKELVSKEGPESKKSRIEKYSEQPDQFDETNSKAKIKEDYLSATIFLSAEKEGDNIKKEDEKGFGIVADINHLTAGKIKIENLASEEAFPNVEEVLTNIKKEDDIDNSVGRAIKIESGSGYGNQAEFLNDKKKATIPEFNHISVGEIKLEDDIYEKNPETEDESFNSASNSKEETACFTIKYELDSDGVDLSSEEESSSAFSKWKDEDDDMPTSSKRIKEAKNKASESDQENTDHPSDDEEEFLSDDVSGDEEFLSDCGENNSDNQNLNVNNKDIVSQLLDEYHKRPQLWYNEILTELNDQKELQLFRGITNALRKKFDMKFNMERVKTLLNTLRSLYETEIERQLKENEETTAESSNLWFYDKMFFVKDDVENTAKLKLEKSLKVDDMPTTSKKIKEEQTSLPATKEETYNESDGDQEDTNHPSHDEEEFLSDDASGDEEYLNDGNENSSDNQNLNVDNKDVVSQLLNEYHKKPQLWFKELSVELNDQKELQLFRSITYALRKKFNMKFDMERVKTLLNTLRSQYETEIERQLNENEETTAESSNLWFYDKMFFVKDDIESGVKLKLEKSLKALDDNILGGLIEIYKNYDDLWDTSKPTFINKKMRLETLKSMCLEIKTKMNISLNSFKLECHLSNVHKTVKWEKNRRFTCEARRDDYKPLLPIVNKCDFLEDHLEPFKCHVCMKVCTTYGKFREHKAQHDGSHPFECNVCGKVCESASSLRSHIFCHDGISYNCSIFVNEYSHPQNLKYHCGKTFNHPNFLKAHIRDVHMFRFKCKICAEVCSNQKSFNQHTALHQGKLFSCDICGRGFDDLKKVKQHKLIHKKEFPCKVCGKVYKSKQNLDYHSFTHIDGKYDCKICGTTFDHPSKFNMHMDLHSQKYKCSFCGNIYVTKSTLNRHLTKCKEREN